MIVVDASVLAPALADDGPDGDRARARLRGEEIAAPGMVDLEVASALRRGVATGRVGERRARQALADLTVLPLGRVPHLPLLERVLELRANLTVYDGAYVALAEALDAPLLTADAKLSRAPGVRCPVELVSSVAG